MRKLIFMDAEFTKLTTTGVKFLSIALITMEGKELYLEIKQEKEEIDHWVQKNVLPLMQCNAVTEEEAKEKISGFLKENYKGEKPTLVADVNQFDWNGICTLFGVWDIPFFYIPIDFSTILFTKGIDIDIDRLELAKDLGVNIEGFKQHNALTDTKILKACWDKLISTPKTSKPVLEDVQSCYKTEDEVLKEQREEYVKEIIEKLKEAASYGEKKLIIPYDEDVEKELIKFGFSTEVHTNTMGYKDMCISGWAKK